MPTSRRKFLALAGTVPAALVSGCSVLDGASGADPSPPGREQGVNGEAVSTPEERTTTSAQNGVDITRFGAVAGRDTSEVARQNREAIAEAARAAGAHGTVSVPEGEFFFGDPQLLNQFSFGTRAPKGISLEGAGPRRSSLTLTSTIGPDSSYRAFRYKASDSGGDVVDHGSVTISDLCLNGNYEELELGEGRTVWGLYALGEGKFNLLNTWIRGWWANGSKFKDVSAEIRRCRYQENGIGVAQTNSEQTAGHHISGWPATRNSILIENCEFLRCSGTVLNRSFNNGDVVLRNVWVRGAGYGCFKLSKTDGTTLAENIYYQPSTDWMSQNLPQRFEQNGRWFLYRVYGEGWKPTVVLNNVVARGMSRGFLLCFEETGLVLRGDRIAIHDAAGKDSREAAIRGDNGLEFDVRNMSVHGTQGAVFDAPESTGVIDNLYRDGNEGLGALGDVSLNDHPNSEPIELPVVSPASIGILPQDTPPSERPTARDVE